MDGCRAGNAISTLDALDERRRSYYDKGPPPPPPLAELLAERPVSRPSSARATGFSSTMGAIQPRSYREAPALLAPQPRSHRESPSPHITTRLASARAAVDGTAADTDGQRPKHPTQTSRRPAHPSRQQPQSGRPQPTQPPQPPRTATGRLVAQMHPSMSGQPPATIRALQAAIGGEPGWPSYTASQDGPELKPERKRSESARSAADSTLRLNPAFASKLAMLRERWRVADRLAKAPVDVVATELGSARFKYHHIPIKIPTPPEAQLTVPERSTAGEIRAPRPPRGSTCRGSSRHGAVRPPHRKTHATWHSTALREAISYFPHGAWETTKMCDWKAVRDAKAAQDVHPVRPAGLTKREEETHQNVDYAGFTYAGDQHGKRTFGGQVPFELSRADEKERDKNRPKGKRCLSRA